MTINVDDQMMIVAAGVTREQLEQALATAGIRGGWSIQEYWQQGWAFYVSLFYPNDNFDEIVEAVRQELPVRVVTLLEFDEIAS